MKQISLIFILIFFYTHHVLACNESSMTYYELALNSKATYVGGVMSMAIPGLKKEHMNGDLAYPNVMHRNNRVVTVNVYETLNGEQKDTLEVTLDWCTGKEVKLGKRVLVYLIDNVWHIKHDEFAISEVSAVLATQSSAKHHAIASHSNH